MKKNIDQWTLNLYLLSCDGANSVTVHVGDWDMWNFGGQDIGEFSVQAQEIIMHEDYGTNGYAHDVCLLRVPTLSSEKFGFK